MLPWAQFWYNCSWHQSIGMTPLKVLYGRDPPTVIKNKTTFNDLICVKDMLLARDATLQQLKLGM